MVRKGGFRTQVLIFFQTFMKKRNHLKHNRKQHLLLSNLSLGVNIDKSELPMTLKNGWKWED